MEDNIISRDIQIEIMKFFINTSIPRIMKENINSN